MMNSNNVIQFPKEYNGPLVNGMSVYEINENVNMMKQFHIQETVDMIVPIIFNHFDIAGFELIDDNDEMYALKDGALVVESLRSMLCKYYDVYHPLQIVSESLFVEQDSENSMKIAETLNVVLKNPETEED